MPTRKHEDAKKAHRESPALSLHVEPAEEKERNVDAEHFFSLAERWLKSLKAFAAETGTRVTWEIVDLKKSSAFVQVRPIDAQSRKPMPFLVRKWDAGVRQLQRTGRPPEGFSTTSLEALQEFVRAVPPDSEVSLGTAAKKRKPIIVTAETQRRVEEAVALAKAAVPLEYSVRGTLRGRLAVLNSWNPADRSFRLQVPLSPGKGVQCSYKDEDLVTQLGSGFEGVVEVDGVLHYRREEVWPYSADVDATRVLSRSEPVPLHALVGLLHLPEGTDSVSYVRRVRDAE